MRRCLCSSFISPLSAVLVPCGLVFPYDAHAAEVSVEMSWLAATVLALVGGGALFLIFRCHRLQKQIAAMRETEAAQVRETAQAAESARKAAAVIQESERRFRDFAECTGDWFWETDSEHRFTYLSNTAIGAMMEIDGGVLGACRWDFIPADEAASEKWQRHRMDMEAHRPIENFRYSLKVGNGHVYHLRVDGVPVFGEFGDFQGYRGAVRDVTETVEAQMSLLSSKESYQNLVEGSLQGILIHVDFRPVFANQAYADIFGYDSGSEILALSSQLDLIAPEDRKRLTDYKEARLVGDGAPRTYTFMGVRKDGSRILVENRVSVIEWEGEKAILTTVIDVSDRLHKDGAD